MSTDPTWVEVAGYSVEKLHSNVLAHALRSGKPAAKELASALWQLASEEVVPAAEITSIRVKCEHRLGKGLHSVVDLFLEIISGGVARQLAIEVKVDGPPNGAQLATMAKALGIGPHRRLVLLSFGGAQVCRLEAERKLDDLKLTIPRWGLKEILAIGKSIKAAALAPAVTQDWLTELEREERRRTGAFDEGLASLAGPYRGRLRDIYRCSLLAETVGPDGGSWNVSVQPFGVVMTERSSHRYVKAHNGTKVTVYLQAVDSILRVKAGAWDGPADPRAATQSVLPLIRATMESNGFKVETAVQRMGKSVSLLAIDPHEKDLSQEALVQRLRRAYKAWCSIPWPS